MAYGWPSNVRELREAVEAAFARGTGEAVRFEHLPAGVRAGSRTEAARDPERRPTLAESEAEFLRRLEATTASIGHSVADVRRLLDWAERRLVLRKQPAGPILRGAHAIDREYRVLVALHPTSVPVPAPVLYHADTDTIGTPFYLMERINGRVFTDTSLSDLSSDERAPIWMAVADTMAAMHAVRPDEVGLSDFGRPGNYFERQISRWDRQYRASPSGPIVRT